MMQQSWIAQQARLIDRSIGLPRPEGIRDSGFFPSLQSRGTQLKESWRQ
jgi:hypothetical protein